MTVAAIFLAAALSAGADEFERSAAEGAADIALSRVRASLVANGPAKAGLAEAMLADTAAHQSRTASVERCRALYAAAASNELAAAAAEVRARLALGADWHSDFTAADRTNVMGRFETDFDAARASACAKQAETLAAGIRPDEAEIESKDDATLVREMTDRIVASRAQPVFEENVGYVSETVVKPVVAAGRKERQRQKEYLMRTKADAYAPSAIAAELSKNLSANVEARRKKAAAGEIAWGVFPGVVRDEIPVAAERRAIDRVVKGVDEAELKVDAARVAETIAQSPELHRRAADSESIFRGIYATALADTAIGSARASAPEAEREEFENFVRDRLDNPALTKALDARVRRDVLPKWREARAAAAAHETDTLWPTLADGTWYPAADLADRTAARSDYKAALGAWRGEPDLAELAAVEKEKTVMEETDAAADKRVAAAFDLARNAIAAQNRILGEVEPEILAKAKDRKSSFWQSTPDFNSIVAMLTDGVQANWKSSRVATLWPPDVPLPKNYEEQHKDLFPSVKKRIELVARSILEDLQKPDPEPEKKPEPEPEEKPEEPSDSESESEEPLMMISITVSREGDRVKVKLQGGGTTDERETNAKMGEFREAMKGISETLGGKILKLK